MTVRAILTGEELEALPVGSIVLNEHDGQVAIRCAATSGAIGWSITGDGGFHQSWYLLSETEFRGSWTRLR